MNVSSLVTPRVRALVERAYFRPSGFVNAQGFGSELFTYEPTSKILGCDGSDTAVVIQGPVVTRRRFTERSLRLLKYQYPRIQLVLSTWSDTSREVLQHIAPLVDDLVLSKKPQQPGPANINLQIHSTQEGLQRVDASSVKYLLKSRTDLALLDDFWLDTMKQRLLSRSSASSDAPSPICVSSLNSYFFRLYTISDFIQFGPTKEVTEFWKIKNDTRSKLPPAPSPVEWAQLCAAEARPCVTLAQRQLGHLNWSMKESLDLVRHRYRFVDSDRIGLFWFKYDWFKNHREIMRLAKGNRIMWSESLEEIVHSNFEELPFSALDAMAKRPFGDVRTK